MRPAVRAFAARLDALAPNSAEARAVYLEAQRAGVVEELLDVLRAGARSQLREAEAIARGRLRLVTGGAK